MITLAREPSPMQTSEERLQRRICFVCTGNTCRSPMAAAVANALAAESEEPSVVAVSAGLCACNGAPISPNALLALEEAGVPPVPGLDYRAHHARGLTEQEAESCDLLIPLTREHALSLLLTYPQFASRILPFPRQVADPFGGDMEVYRQCLAEITEGVRALLGAEEANR